MWKNNKINSVTIFGPKNVLTNWEEDIYKELLIPYKLTWNELKPIKEENILHINLVNYERLPKKDKPTKYYFDMAIADESHKIKSRNSNASKATWRRSKGCKYRIALSGTPMGNTEIDFFAQCRFINPELFGERYKDFDTYYFKPCGYMGYKRKFKSELRRLKFYKIINENSYRVLKAEVLDLKPITEEKVLIDINRKPYEKLEKEMVINFKDENNNLITISPKLAITLVSKLQQLCCGFIYTEEHDIIPYDDAKLKSLESILRENKGKKFVIFCNYSYDIHRINEYLKGKYKIITYDSNTKDRKVWKKLNEADIFLSQIKCGGTGLNLQEASVMIFYSPSYSYIDMSQAKDRIYRRGQKKAVKIYYLLAKNTIEENIYNVLQAKKSGAKAVLDDYRKSHKIL